MNLHVRFGVNLHCHFGLKVVNSEIWRILRKCVKRNHRALNDPSVVTFFGTVLICISNSVWICIFTLVWKRNFIFGRRCISGQTRIFTIQKSSGFRVKSPYGRNAFRRNFVCNVGLCSDSRMKMAEWEWKVIAILSLNRSDSRGIQHYFVWKWDNIQGKELKLFQWNIPELCLKIGPKSTAIPTK